MKAFRSCVHAGLFTFLLLLFVTPAFAQFEVNPDHPDNQPTATAKKKTANAKTQSVQRPSSRQLQSSNSSANAAQPANKSTQTKRARQHASAGDASTANASASVPSSTKAPAPHSQATPIPQPQHFAQSSPVLRE